MTDTIHVLYADHPARGRWRLRDAFGSARNGVQISEVGLLAELEERLRDADYDLVVCDPDIPGCEGLELLEVVRAVRPDLPIVVVTADEERALEAVRRGVAGCVSRTPRQLLRLPYVIRDVVERKRLQDANRRAEEELRESEARFRSLTELSSDVYWEQDDQYRFTSFSDAGPESISSTNHRRLGKKRWEQDYVNMSAADWAAHIAALDARRRFHDLELCRLTDRGDKVWITVSGEPVFDAAGVFKGYRGVGREITARKQGEMLLALEHAVTRRLAEADSASTAMQAVIRTMCEALGSLCGRYFRADEAAGVLRFDEAWGVADPAVERLIADCRALVFRPGEELAGRVWECGRPLWSREAGEDLHASGAPRHGAATSSGVLALPVISEGKTIGVLSLNGGQISGPDQRLTETIRAIGSQIGQFLLRKQVEERMARLAQFDAVTGLPNRHLLQDHLGLLLAQARRNDWRVGLLFVDLDRFKAVNDTYGHAAGDALLRQVSTRLKECVRSGDTVGRLSGDEFAVVLSTLTWANDAGLVAQKIVGALAAPFDLDEGQVCISASVGIALYPDDGTEPDALVKNADAAMYRVKEQGRNGFQFTRRK